jgi:HAD superfamily phosphoserine phosphatase-like hydrolase
MISVVIPALNESANIASVIALAKRSPLVREVIVVDDGSVDGTPEIAQAAGARVITSTLLGKGGSMKDGLDVSSGEIVAYLDGDLAGLRDDLVNVLCSPILEGRADFAKATFTRSAGRVTVLTARPLLQIFFPELAHFSQPLGGIIAARRSVLENIRFEPDYGVDIGLLIDVSQAGYRIEEIDIGHLEHDSQTLEALGDMAKQVVRTLLHRADQSGRLVGQRLAEVEEVDRVAQSELSLVLGTLGRVRRLALFDMDGTLVQGRFITALAERTGRTKLLSKWLDNFSVSADERTARIAAIFKGVPKEEFEKTASELPLTPGACATIVTLRKLGFRVGVVSDSYRIATEIVRRRVFADFSVSNLSRFQNGVSTGDITMSPAWMASDGRGCLEHVACKGNAVRHLVERIGVRRKFVVAVGDGQNDLCMFREAGLSIAFEPKHPLVRQTAEHCVSGDLREVLALLLDQGGKAMKIRPGLIEMARKACNSILLTDTAVPASPASPVWT